MSVRSWFATATSLALALATFGPATAQAADAKDPPPVEVLVADLTAALKGEDDATMVAAIEHAAGSRDPKVLALLEKALREVKHPAAIDAAILALAQTDDPRARKALYDAAARARTKDLTGLEGSYALLLREIGRLGDPEGIDALVNKPFNNLTYDVGVARIMGLARIRTAGALEALLELSTLAGGRGGASGALAVDHGRFRPWFRVAMASMTGRDEGLVPADWERWWREHGREAALAVPSDRPRVPKDVSLAWEQYWGERYYPEGGEPPAPRMGSPIVLVPTPTPEQVKTAVQALKDAFKSKEYEPIVTALGQYGGVLDKKVVHEIAAGLRSRDDRVRSVTMETLGWMRYEPALKQLHREFRRGRSEWPKNEDLFATLLKAIGRHGDPSSVAVLRDDPFRALTIATGRARILGLANIRTRDALDALIKGTQLAGANRPRAFGRNSIGEERFLREFHLGLVMLTGEDLGSDLETWRQWWRKSKGSYKVPVDRPSVPSWAERLWTTFWGENYGGLEEGGPR